MTNQIELLQRIERRAEILYPGAWRIYYGPAGKGFRVSVSSSQDFGAHLTAEGATLSEALINLRDLPDFSGWPS